MAEKNKSCGRIYAFYKADSEFTPYKLIKYSKNKDTNDTTIELKLDSKDKDKEFNNSTTHQIVSMTISLEEHLYFITNTF